MTTNQPMIEDFTGTYPAPHRHQIENGERLVCPETACQWHREAPAR